MARKKDIPIGTLFGRLTVVGSAKSRTIKGGAMVAFWKCRCTCGKYTEISGGNLRAGKANSCGCLKQELQKARTGEKSQSWKGGRSLDSNGYVRVWLPKDHPWFPAIRWGTREHLVVMTEFLGRRLLPEETVHHKNGIRSDNRIENLELWASNHAPGQRVEDLLTWAKQIKQKYAAGENW